jgi:hypothetical protein
MNLAKDRYYASLRRTLVLFVSSFSGGFRWQQNMKKKRTTTSKPGFKSKNCAERVAFWQGFFCYYLLIDKLHPYVIVHHHIIFYNRLFPYSFEVETIFFEHFHGSGIMCENLGIHTDYFKMIFDIFQ